MKLYNGRTGFETFSHQKSILDPKCWLDLPMRYQPYTSRLNQWLIRLFFKMIPDSRPPLDQSVSKTMCQF